MAAKPLKGYKRLPGTPRRYLTPSGRKITEYEYRSRKARRVKGPDGKPVFRNYSQQRKFRESQEFMRLRFNVKSAGQDALIDYGSDLEAAAFELSVDDRLGTPGEVAYEMKESSRYGQLLAAQGMPDWYFWRFWYSETNAS